MKFAVSVLLFQDLNRDKSSCPDVLGEPSNRARQESTEEGTGSYLFPFCEHVGPLLRSETNPSEVQKDAWLSGCEPFYKSSPPVKTRC